MNNMGVDPGTVFGLAVASIGLVFMLLVFRIMMWLLPAWLRGFLGGTSVMLLQLIAMRLRGVPPGLIVDALVTLVQRGHPHDLSRVRMAESLYLAQRGLIDSPAQLADQMEKQIKTGKLSISQLVSGLGCCWPTLGQRPLIRRQRPAQSRKDCRKCESPNQARHLRAFGGA